jgi:predicted DNA-binding ribbon-helix-helix protein
MQMQTTVHKRSILINGRKTSVSLEDGFWQGLREVAQENNESVSTLASRIDKTRDLNNLSSAIRVFVLDHYRSRVQPAVPECEAA